MNEQHPLGQPTNRSEPPTKEQWFPVPDKPWLERNAKGDLRTKLPDPFNSAVWPFGKP
jgi:hypothetical protein